VGGEKGGSGKSCLAQNLAVYLQKNSRDVLLLDADPQGTTTDWIKERDDNLDLKSIPAVQAAGNIRHVLMDLSKRYQDIIIDAGGQDSEALRSAMTIATHMLLPFRPKRRDLKTLVHIEKLIKLAKAVNPNLKTSAVITQCPTLPSQSQRILDAKDACESFGLIALNQFTTNRNVYDDADENGLSVFEVESDPKAKAEIESIAIEFFGVI
jgi:chromosome partitioning protein